MTTYCEKTTSALCPWTVVVILIFLPAAAFGQPRKIKEYKSNFQFSLFPGINTNGINGGSYYNKYSFNLFGGLSRGNRVLEMSPLSNSSIMSTSGFQFAGLANVVGANAFMNLTVAEEVAVMHQEYESNANGVQLAGLLNYVRNHVVGFQFSGGLNVIGKNLRGAQISGIGNSAGGYGMGMQLAGFYNITKESFGGVQLSSLFNYTDRQLAGAQIGLINKAARITGKNSEPRTSSRGIQIGLVNFSKAMDGTQIGLLNFGVDTHGNQVGLINFFHGSANPRRDNVRHGTPIALWNVGSNHSYFRLYHNELFPLNVERTTGNCQNCSGSLTDLPFYEQNKKVNQNPLIIGFNPSQHTWGFGYGFQKILSNKFSIAPNPRNERRIMGYGIKFLHLNKALGLDKSFNLVSRLNFDYGRRWRFGYAYAGVAMNYFLHEAQATLDLFKIKAAAISTGKQFGLNSNIWPGYEVGIHF